MVLVVDSLTKIFKHDNSENKVLDNVSFTVENSEIFGILGESGAGKSTLLRCLNQIDVQTSGSILYDDIAIESLSSKDLRLFRHKIGVVFQGFNLIQNITVWDNVSRPLLLSHSVDKQHIDAMLSFVGLSDKASRYPSQLSGGEKQRVAIARALVNNPEFLICDEPTSALDPQTTKEIGDVLKRINTTFGTTILIVTHELDVAKALCSRVALLDKGRCVDIITVTPPDQCGVVAHYHALAREVLTQ